MKTVATVSYKGVGSGLVTFSSLLFEINALADLLFSAALCYCPWAFSSHGKWGCPPLAAHGLPVAPASLAADTGSGPWAPWSWHTSLVALRPVEFSWTGDHQTCVPCITRRILDHGTTSQVLTFL